MELLEDRRVLAATVDVVFLMDGSGSGDATAMKDWLKDTVFAAVPGSSHPIAETLASKGITDVRYGLIGFGDGASNGFAHSYVVNPNEADPLFGNANQMEIKGVRTI